ncbi:hypothetical protein sos41_31330 [Alphaproteobacteria bacterium SO-S41]|nr:hypothetical protein sos41_31330 [Alphaproteobacteria bacterium SO-S41]
MAAKDETAPKGSKYRVIDNLRHDGKAYGPGLKGADTIELSDEAAGALLEAKVIEPAKGKAAEAPAA